MLNKYKMVPGSKIQVKPILKDGFGGSVTALPVFDLTNGPMISEVITGGAYQITSGNVLTVVNGPKKRYGGINLARVQLPDGSVGDLYWLSLRLSCDHI